MVTCFFDSQCSIVVNALVLLLSLTKHVLDDDFVLLTKKSECVPSGLTGRYWIRSDPTTTGELIEVITRTHCVVHSVQYSAGRRHTSLRCAQLFYKQTFTLQCF